VAVVEQEKPQSPILWVNSAAAGAGIRPGMRYASGLSLDRNLCAGTVSEEEIGAAVRQVHELLADFSPGVEPSEDEPGIFWVDATRLDRLYGSFENWTREMASGFSRLELPASIVVGFSRFGSYAIAKAENRVTVLPSFELEEVCSRKVRLQHLRIDPNLRDRLEKLGIHTVGDFLDLPQGGIARHLGREARTLYRLAAGELSLPLQPRMIPEPLRARTELEEPESNAPRLLFRIKQLLDPLLLAAADRGQKVAVLRLQLLLEDGDRRLEQIQPARPTLKVSALLDLVRLRLESLSLPVRPVELSLEVEGVSAAPRVVSLLQRNPSRNLEAALRALARVRAEFGPDSVVSARLKSGHLPEARCEWRPLEKLPAASPRSVSLRPLVRRAHARPRPLERSPFESASRWKRSQELGRLLGYLISGGWWSREVRRDYRFAGTGRGEILWVYYDQKRRRWYSQGRVE
jgi:protein ImuB